ncbi:MAG: Fic family protein [Methanolobus sp.]|uniref:Fic family protein n=1 Tax=Methanolobus sp. TaxID=1874737 RepID=UPI002730B7B6|nr:Fic family protein [Methanolobus sp.]MDP2217577.1 Fic family protein [Methanolobus sp.]
MDELLGRVRAAGTHPIETVALLYHRLVEIHPFTDGNGRVARLLTNLYLISRNYPPVVLKKEDRRQYYASLRSADSGNLKPLAQFIAKAVDHSLTLYVSASGGSDELLLLKELAGYTPYSQEYLSLRARQ